jgi:hypothetical protein
MRSAACIWITASDPKPSFKSQTFELSGLPLVVRLSEGLGRTSPEIAVGVCRQVQKRDHRGNDEAFQV